jgi:hypothetical protein
MNATEEQIEQSEQVAVAALPELAVPDAESAISIVNGWLHTEVGTAVNVSRAYFKAASYCWHLPVQLIYPDTGLVGVIGDVFLHAATGQLVGLPDAEELKQRAIALAEAHGLLEEGEEDEAAVA